VSQGAHDATNASKVLMRLAGRPNLTIVAQRELNMADGSGGRREQARNVLGGPLVLCSDTPLTGFFRDGCCHTGPSDQGRHVVCAQVSAEFLAFSRSRGNDLSTPRPEFRFPGLKPGDFWCLCALRWAEALEAGLAPKVRLEACHIGALNYVTLADLQRHAL